MALLPMRRSEVGMTMHCMRSYTLLVIKTCHKRGVHAMGGMAAHIPIRDDAAANQARSRHPCTTVIVLRPSCTL